jgi:hypothetical protein
MCLRLIEESVVGEVWKTVGRTLDIPLCFLFLDYIERHLSNLDWVCCAYNAQEVTVVCKAESMTIRK